eukprot:COSAG01_NODE_35140_length_536_cov_1.308924_1_plen_43_part_10
MKPSHGNIGKLMRPSKYLYCHYSTRYYLDNIPCAERGLSKSLL